ncbi:UrvD/REP family ATP-dependent DNA helicase [Cellulomonas sp. PhB143]|uniref:UrvD/REP family ATP-dependent DNA helicase n=1 Tax=Cellulomonas sp. PhB143 TaxID=2485186 RepID=UPI001F2BD93D|nr:UrvD/REP family ATP-dependent DNA helicase [Cellulomonas sp. PhB143]
MIAPPGSPTLAAPVSAEHTLAQAGTAGLPALDAGQREALDSLRSRAATLVVGAPGTGKTTLAVAAAVDAVVARGLDPRRVLVLAASRRSAAVLRDRVAAATGRTTSTPLVRTPASAAFAVLRTGAAASGAPAPTLVTGPEQDLVLADLLAGHVAGDAAPLELPPGLEEEVLALRGFRQELRDLLMRAAERGLGPADLDDLGRRHGRPEWSTAARLYEEYLDVMALGTGTPDAGARVDPAVVLDEATALLAGWSTLVDGAPRPGWDLVVVDDYQEATAATAAFLREVHGAGARLLLLADPDASVQAFRGAVPGLVGRADAPSAGAGTDWDGELGAHRVVLRTAWRQAPGLRAVTRAVTTRIGVVGGAQHRSAEPPVEEMPAGEPERPADGAAPERAADGAGTQGAWVAVLPSAAQEAAFVARELRAEHLLHGTPWSRMAVVARSGSQLATLRRGLLAASVPVATTGSDVPLRDEPAVAPLLDAVRVGSAVAAGDDDPLAAQTAVALMTSPLGATDVVALRRLRRALRAEELAGGGGRTSDELLVDVLVDPTRAATLPSGVRRGALQVARVVAAASAAVAAPGADPQSVLWAVWDAAGLAGPWRAAALAGGPAAARADRDLDAVLALFRAAETFVDRMPGASALAFVQHLASQDLPADSLAATAAGVGAVDAVTPAGAAGREWDVVVVAGVQDGLWPDLRLRDSLLGSQALVDLLAGRSPDGRTAGREARRAVLDDELRAFAVASSRARRRLIVTAVDDVDSSPSVFCDLVDGGPAGDEASGQASTADRRRASVGHPLDLRGVVAGARSLLAAEAAGQEPTAGGDLAARLLAALGAAGVAEADPERWYAVHDVSSSVPLWSADDDVRVSPSKVESVDRCALRWALESGGATAPDATAQTLGTLIHSIAQDLPDGTHHELAAELDRRFPELGTAPGWATTSARKSADRMIERLAGYVKGAGEVLAVEAPFELRVGRAVLKGVVDRIERAEDGQVLVSDLKTGASAVTRADAEVNPQLGAYQLAVDGGAFDLPGGTRSAGGRLVYLGAGRNATLREQPALEPDDDGRTWAHGLVEDVADTMASSVFRARQNSLCAACPVRRSCPAQPEGREVVA